MSTPIGAGQRVTIKGTSKYSAFRYTSKKYFRDIRAFV